MLLVQTTKTLHPLKYNLNIRTGTFKPNPMLTGLSPVSRQARVKTPSRGIGGRGGETPPQLAGGDACAPSFSEML
jgi:hypothetical protein